MTEHKFKYEVKVLNKKIHILEACRNCKLWFDHMFDAEEICKFRMTELRELNKECNGRNNAEGIRKGLSIS